VVAGCDHSASAELVAPAVANLLKTEAAAA
jgi:hypothetical protein